MNKENDGNGLEATVALIVLIIALVFAWKFLDASQRQAAALERQAVAAEQQTKLLQEPGAMTRDLHELVDVLKQLQAADAASAPGR